MPKIIKDIEEKISSASIRLFGEYGYEAVDMKLIAKESGVAVGTLYNYYSRKSELFLEVFVKSWEKTLSKLKEERNKDISKEKKINKYLEILYDDIEMRKGIIKIDFNIKNSREREQFVYFKEKIIGEIQEIFNEQISGDVIEKKYDVSLRLIETIFSVIRVMIENHKEDRRDNLDFLNTIFLSFMK
ncbi:bacterial regulatory s, tetR family protein [Clostridium sporogenes]|uniref:Bacterial regulatory s, tetR family protein n=1 Tax=Clostridium sporogenes TaxID=1509 RepID=A0A1L3NEI9_CLOSG|nr:TetR/AcrR family transcriptional regulator [Clostridium sporogenes]APH14545.1 bacterial regulatory s, tetR family protein [Clostridium sporogenes]